MNAHLLLAAALLLISAFAVGCDDDDDYSHVNIRQTLGQLTNVRVNAEQTVIPEGVVVQVTAIGFDKQNYPISVQLSSADPEILGVFEITDDDDETARGQYALAGARVGRTHIIVSSANGGSDRIDVQVTEQ